MTLEPNRTGVRVIVQECYRAIRLHGCNLIYYLLSAKCFLFLLVLTFLIINLYLFAALLCSVILYMSPWAL